MTRSVRSKVANRPHVVYALRDAADVTFYVGLTCNLKHRTAQHFADSRFARQIARVDVLDTYPDRASARQGEANWIWHYEPSYNLVGNPAVVREQIALRLFTETFGANAAERLSPDLDAKLGAVLAYAGPDAVGAAGSLLIRNYITAYTMHRADAAA